jgi:hypothetical protein
MPTKKLVFNPTDLDVPFDEYEGHLAAGYHLTPDDRDLRVVFDYDPKLDFALVNDELSEVTITALRKLFVASAWLSCKEHVIYRSLLCGFTPTLSQVLTYVYDVWRGWLSDIHDPERSLEDAITEGIADLIDAEILTEEHDEIEVEIEAEMYMKDRMERRAVTCLKYIHAAIPDRPGKAWHSRFALEVISLLAEFGFKDGVA